MNVIVGRKGWVRVDPGASFDRVPTRIIEHPKKDLLFPDQAYPGPDQNRNEQNVPYTARQAPRRVDVGASIKKSHTRPYRAIQGRFAIVCKAQ